MRRLLVGALALLAALAAADYALWLIATARLEDELAAWQARRGAAGWTLSAGQPVRGGWPLAAAITLAEPVLAGGAQDLPGGLTWRAGQAELAVALLRPGQLRVRIAGPQRLRVASLPDIAFTADHFELSIPLAGIAADRLPLDLAAAGLRVAASTGPVEIATLALHLESWAAAPAGAAALTVRGEATSLDLPPLRHARPWPLGPRIAAASLEASFGGPWPGGATVATRAAGWRDAGGQLELRHLALAWGPLGLSASATAGLDGQLQPTGAATARVVGYDATLEALAAAGLLAPRVAQAIGAVLGLLARPAQPGGPPQVEVPLTLQSRTLSLGPFPLLRLREWVWR